ncbi:MAG TPA: PaaX family transcriptional regulator C-terminal domain-containing protein [Acidimicrobiales bacterium]|nr:PaaX family transcriptional regulator C-terminal domain-containing protein [Acidimicrobiales bacterium]
MASRRNTPDRRDRSDRSDRRARPDRPRLTARSVIASTLLGVDPPELPTRSLVASAELLGVTAGTARVGMSRMVAAGELEATGDGYRLAGHLLARQARQAQSRTGTPDGWDGAWRTALVPGEARAATDRADLRRAMSALRYGELRDGVWLRPDNLPAGALASAQAVAAAQTIALVGPLDPGTDPVVLARSLWDLDGWAETAAALVDELAPLQERLDHDDATALAEGFVVSAAVLRHLQADPLLPAALLPDHWPGTRLRSREDRFDHTFKAVLRTWLLARA